MSNRFIRLSMLEKHKVLTYITRGNRLLVFTHPDAPEAGIQVPGGTIEMGEPIEDAALREAIEETGLACLRLNTYLGELRRDMSDFGLNEIHHRYYFHVWCDEETPTNWQHGEYESSTEHIPFDFNWVELNDNMPELIADHDAFIPELTAYLGI